MRTVLLRSILATNARLDVNPSQSASPGMNQDGDRAVYAVHAVPDSVDNRVILHMAHVTAFVGTYEADYAQLGAGRIVRG